MSERVLITRTREDSLKLAEQFSPHNIVSVIEPLLTIEHLPVAPLDFIPDVIVATSRFALTQHTTIDKPIIVTGDGSAAKARHFGYTQITTLASARLVPKYIESHFPKAAKILYYAGHDITIDIATALREMGYDATRVTTYIAHAATALSADTEKHLRAGEVSAALFFSARTFAIYEKLVTEAGLSEQQKSIEAFCLSPEIAEAAKRLPFKQIHAAEKTDTQTLVNEVVSRYTS